MAATKVSSYQILSSLAVKLTFTNRLVVNGLLFSPSCYGFGVRLGYAKPVYSRLVTASSSVVGDLVTDVTVYMRDFFSLNGRYNVRVQGVIDEFGQLVDTGISFINT